jgi:hypothetical protein
VSVRRSNTQILTKEILSHFVPNIFLWLFYILKVCKLGSYLHITNIWGNFRSKFCYLTPRGGNFMVSPPAVWQLMVEKYYHTLPRIYFCGYFISSKGPNWEVICILPIFEVVFGQNLGTLAPGVTLYSVTTCCLAI